MVKPIKLDELPLATSVDAADELVIAKPSGVLERVTAANAFPPKWKDLFDSPNLLVGANNVECHQDAYELCAISKPTPLVEGETYTITIRYRCNPGTAYLRLYPQHSGSATEHHFSSKVWTTESHTFTATAKDVMYPGKNSSYFYQYPQNEAKGAEIAWAVLRKGESPVSEWIPAPQDFATVVGGGKYLCFSGYAVEGRAA